MDESIDEFMLRIAWPTGVEPTANLLSTFFDLRDQVYHAQWEGVAEDLRSSIPTCPDRKREERAGHLNIIEQLRELEKMYGHLRAYDDHTRKNIYITTDRSSASHDSCSRAS